MLFNSVDFLIFFPIVVFIYFIIPKKIRYIWLLAASYFFYMGWNAKYAILIALSTLITYLSGILISKSNTKKIKITWLVLCLLSNLGILVVFKYANFFINNISSLLSYFNISFIEKRFDLLLPVGISFYTFQALSYTIDVYKEKIKPEKNFLRYALYVSFFPQLVAGPIERSENLLSQVNSIEKINVWNSTRIKNGLMLMLWGFFQKLVIADRISILVENVLNNYTSFGFAEITIAIVLFAFQIYCDFGGYTNIARGAAEVMGFSLMKNFKEPYLAMSIKDFWHRWHISLTSWFTDYLYIPLGGSRKGRTRKYVNILIVFLISGLWHGASWNFIIWGLIHAIYQILGDIKDNIILKHNNKSNEMSIITKIRKIICTFLIVDFAWIFFAANSLSHAINIIKQMFTSLYTSKINELGLNTGNFVVLGIALIILIIVDIIKNKNISILSWYNKRNIVVKESLILAIVWIIIMFGIYGPSYDTSTFIYFQF